MIYICLIYELNSNQGRDRSPPGQLERRATHRSDGAGVCQRGPAVNRPENIAPRREIGMERPGNFPGPRTSDERKKSVLDQPVMLAKGCQDCRPGRIAMRHERRLFLAVAAIGNHPKENSGHPRRPDVLQRVVPAQPANAGEGCGFLAVHPRQSRVMHVGLTGTIRDLACLPRGSKRHTGGQQIRQVARKSCPVVRGHRHTSGQQGRIEPILIPSVFRAGRNDD